MTMDEDVDDITSTKLSSPGAAVRRCLFERPDAETTRRDLDCAWTELRLSSSNTWNFDFDRQRPVAGPIVWTRVGDVWLGKISADSETQCDSIASSVTSTHGTERDHTRRHAPDHTPRVMKSSRRLNRRRQRRVTG